MLRNAPREPGNRRAVRRWRSLGLVAGWCVATAGATAVLSGYTSEPGAPGATPDRWPDGTALAAPDERPMLIMFVHPHCPCSRASVRELARIMPHAIDRMTCRVLFLQPPDQPGTWTRTDLWNLATATPGVDVDVDPEGVEAARFGATTSGHVVVYDAAGRLRFSGGITTARGHEGDSVGRRVIIDLTRGGGDPGAGVTHVFGCAMCPVPPGASGGDDR